MTLRELAWLLVVKLAALTVLWFLFFSPGHRHYVDADAANRQLGIGMEGKKHD